MTVTYGFYNSVNHDRLYSAIQMSNMFDGVIVDGVFRTVGTFLKVVPGTGLQVIVGIGRAWFDHTWTYNDSLLPLDIDLPDMVYTRIDAVVLEVDSSVAVRANGIKVVPGTPAETPLLPTLTNTSEVHQYPLAYVTVPVGMTTIIESDITDMIGTADCPFVAGPLELRVIARQGGDPTDWNQVGTTTYIPGRTGIQVGNNFTAGDAQGRMNVTFPVEFLGKPVVFMTPDEMANDDHLYTAQVLTVETDGFVGLITEHLNTNPYHAYPDRLITINWIAIGPIA